MIITCPNCSTNFSVPQKAIGEAGKKVKCTKCAHIWFQEPIKVKKMDIDELLKVEHQPVPENSNLPVKRISSGVRLSLIAASVVFALLSVGVFWAHGYQANPTVQALIGAEDVSSLSFSKLSLDSQVNDSKMDFKLSGFIKNTSAEVVKVPSLAIKVQSKGDREMAASEMKIEAETIEPGASVPFSADINRISGSADKIIILLANKLEKKYH
jgi:predicted Zn finger-like uncharacterized protein